MALADLIQAGKIRYIGLSNETPWGVMKFRQIAEQLGLPSVISIQNAYNLLNRVSDWAIAEICYREPLGFLAYSPLGFGLLSGKYLEAQPENARMTLFPQFGARYHKPNVNEAVQAYQAIAQRYHLSPAVLAIAFVRSRWFVTSTIVGATSITQLQENLSAVDVSLAAEIVKAIDEVHAQYSSPAP
jgi:aryl-alcohol dehydrogenase (NADP+)